MNYKIYITSTYEAAERLAKRYTVGANGVEWVKYGMSTGVKYSSYIPPELNYNSYCALIAISSKNYFESYEILDLRQVDRGS